MPPGHSLVIKAGLSKITTEEGPPGRYCMYRASICPSVQLKILTVIP